MIQRIQSLWLLLAAAAMIFALYVPFAMESNAHGQTRPLLADDNLSTYLLGLLLSLSALIIIFLFRRRSNQKRLIWLSVLTCVLFMVLMYFQVEEIKNTEQHEAKFRIGAILPVVYIVLMGMAYSGIRKDEKLIKSVNRLR
jgi:peptidoglycan/LPS O-acetylase OafA/YrhL